MKADSIMSVVAQTFTNYNVSLSVIGELSKANQLQQLFEGSTLRNRHHKGFMCICHRLRQALYAKTGLHYVSNENKASEYRIDDTTTSARTGYIKA